MLRISRGVSRTLVLAATLGAAGLLVIATSEPAGAATTIDGPVGLGSAATFGVLGGSTVTNTGPSVIAGNLGVDPGTSITGFPPGQVGGTIHATDQPAILAQSDLTTAYNTAASLSPQASGLHELGGRTLSPGVYSGGSLQVTGDLTLKGSANSVWVFQAASTLTTASSSRVLFSGGASSCNVFWKVGSSATLGSGSSFAGTILALQSITAVTATTVSGRLLARNGAVTLDTNTLTLPSGCGTAGASTVATTPKITSGTPTPAAIGKPYTFRITAPATPVASFAISNGTLPLGLSLNAKTGLVSGTPSTIGSSDFTVVARNSAVSRSSATLSIAVTQSGLALTGVDPVSLLVSGLLLLGAGLSVFFATRLRRYGLHRG